MENTGVNTQTANTYTTQFFAQPYDIDANGFYFGDWEEYQAKAKTCRNRFGNQVEEFEIQFIDGERIDLALFQALGICQATIQPFLDKLDEWDDEEKTMLIIAVGEGGYSFDLEADNVDDFDIDLYPDISLADLAHDFVDQGMFGEISDKLMMYLEYDLIARDLGFDYTETTIAGERYVYRIA